MRFGVLGSGSYGTAIGNYLISRGLETKLWNRSSKTNIESVIDESDVLILGVPAQQMRSFLNSIETEKPVICLAKGIEASNLKRMSQVVASTLGNNTYAILSGPSFAKDIENGNPVGLTLASKDKVFRNQIQSLLSSEKFDIKITDDVCGVEIGGALKNVFAIGAGILSGTGVGESMAGDWLSRCMVEMRETGQVLGGRWETFGGRSGLGDLVITCTESSRNFRFGRNFAECGSIEQSLKEIGSTVEGVSTLQAVHRITQEKSMMTPIIRVLHQTVHERSIDPVDFLSEVRRLDAKRRKEGASTGSVVMRRLLPKMWYRRRK